MLKLDHTLKSYLQFNQCQLFEPHKPHVIFAEFDMDSPLQFPPHLRLDISLLESEGVRLVINQSVVPVDLECSLEDQSCLSVVYTLRL